MVAKFSIKQVERACALGERVEGDAFGCRHQRAGG
jgi:hypothetical protein